MIPTPTIDFIRAFRAADNRYRAQVQIRGEAWFGWGTTEAAAIADLTANIAYSAR